MGRGLISLAHLNSWPDGGGAGAAVTGDWDCDQKVNRNRTEGDQDRGGKELRVRVWGAYNQSTVRSTVQYREYLDRMVLDE